MNRGPYHTLSLLVLLFASAWAIGAPGKPDALIHWAERVLPPILSFSFQDNPQTYWKQYRPLFSKKGWRGFQSALQESGNIHTIIREEIATHIQLGTYRHVTRLKDHSNQWHITFPAQITYAFDTRASRQPIYIAATLTQYPQHVIKIEQIKITNAGKSKYYHLKPRGCKLRTLP